MNYFLVKVNSLAVRHKLSKEDVLRFLILCCAPHVADRLEGQVVMHTGQLAAVERFEWVEQHLKDVYTETNNPSYLEQRLSLF